jgi:hypothetical protein
LQVKIKTLMTDNKSSYKKAYKLVEVDNAVRFNEPIPADHEFFTDFSDVRGDFGDRMIYSPLNVNHTTFEYNREANKGNKALLFLAGMRGSGKTSELAKISKKLHNPYCFYCITCNIDDGWDSNDMEYMDIIIFQMERLFEEVNKEHFVLDGEPILISLNEWFNERVDEVNKVIKKEGGFEIELKANTPSFFNILSLIGKLKANITGSSENAKKIRTTFRNNFIDFANKFNEFVEFVNMKLRNSGKGQEILFIVDGIEKTATVDIRKKVVEELADRISKLKVNMIFTLPLELMPQTQRLMQFSKVVPFPFVKIREREGGLIEKAIKRFEEFVYKRVDTVLFDSNDTVRKAILCSGGSPRNLLRILEYANYNANEAAGKITMQDLDKGISQLAAQTAQYLSTGDLEKLKELKDANEQALVLPIDETWQNLLEQEIILEYNYGTYKRVNPIIEESDLYKQNVG